MGPMAGIGDSINNGTLQYLLIAIALPWAADGLWFGAVIPWIVFSVVTYLYGRAFVHFSYRLGQHFLMKNSAACLFGVPPRFKTR